MLWADGSRYIGYGKNNTKDDKGLYIWPNDGVYLGQFNNNQMNGSGIRKYKDNKMYIGGFSNDAENGEGILLEADKHTAYSGQWQNGQLQAPGFKIVKIDQNNSGTTVHKGQWTMGKKNALVW